MKIIIITARTYQNSNLPPPEMSVEERIVSFLKFYESSLFVIVQDFFNKDILKYRGLWLQQLDKNYERKYRKL